MTRGRLRWVPIKTHCRCTSKKCQRRQVKKMHPDDYVRRPKCYFCKSPIRVDKYMDFQRRETYKTCNCSAYGFPHRQGCKYCYYRKNGERRKPGDPDWHDPEIDRAMQEYYMGD